MFGKQIQNIHFTKELNQMLQKLSDNEKDDVNKHFQGMNDRQKIKHIKKVLEAQEQSQLKNIIRQVAIVPITKQYIFGNTQTKSTLLNIFKVMDVPPKILISVCQSIQNFEHVRLTLEIIETLSISCRFGQKEKAQILQSALIDKIVSYLLAEIQKGGQSIEKNQFRTKWLQFFVQVLRCVNYILRFISKEAEEWKQKLQTFYLIAQKCTNYVHLLNKQVITQLYLILVYLNQQLPFPQLNLQQIHYLNACTVVKGENTLKPLLKLASQLKDTELKTQLSPILLKSFLDYFQQGKKKNMLVQLDEQLKKNAFDSAISLFDVGRSIYNYLEDIISIIITHNGNWSLEGNYVRKFFIAKVALKNVPTKVIFDLWPSCLQDCFIEVGNMTMAYVSSFAETLLLKLYGEVNNDFEKWMSFWIEPYKKSLLSGNRCHLRGITDFINPIILKINSSNSQLLKEVSGLPQENLSTQLGIISLIKCYKEVGKIQLKHNLILQGEKQKQNKQKKKQTQKKQANCLQEKELDNGSDRLLFLHLDDPSFCFGSQFLIDLILSNDSMIALQTFQFLITSRKPSTLITPPEMDLILVFYRNCLKTSMPQYRKNYLNLTKKLLERFRNNYEKDLSQKAQSKQQVKTIKKTTQHYKQFVHFLNKLIDLSFFNIYPDSIFEIANPGLQILHLIIQFFGPKGCQIRKGTFLVPTSILIDETHFFEIYNFENLVSCLQSSYESIRCTAHQIIRNFDSFDELGKQTLKRLWKQAIENTNKLSIRSYQFACRMLSYISSIKNGEHPIIEGLPSKYSFHRLNVCLFLTNILKERYQIFKNQFINQTQTYYKNLLHGILTCLSYLLDEISRSSELTNQNLNDVKSFLSQFFNQVIKIMNFSVEISSANISTVVLDTITLASQTDKKLSVDCRGHFLTEKKNSANSIGSYLDSTALLTSMENQEEGIENTLVVSFYLLTREAGLVFQSIGNLMGNSMIAKCIPKKQLIQLVNTYFYALINLKHMGSVDRISIGLSKMAKVIFDQQDPQLTQLPQNLLNQLIQFLTDGKFTNILRRSAGVPYAFSCLLKSEAIKRKLLIQKTITSLLKLSKQSAQQSPIQLRIHSLNILKKLFQDSDLKQDLDIFVSEAFITSIKGFTSQQWGVRNSSLMLFSVLANRTVGIKPTFNLLEFFHKCPDLLHFIAQQLAQKKTPTMYPPLYPIVLLLSRLLPFDLRQLARISVKGGTNKQMRKQQLLSLQPLVRQAGNNHNYMGRVMTAKAILPFMQLSNIVPHCLRLLSQFNTNYIKRKIINNAEHYRLTECLQLLTSFHQIINNSSQYLSRRLELTQQYEQDIFQSLSKGCSVLQWSPVCGKLIVSPTVQEIVLRIYQQLLLNLTCFGIRPPTQKTNNLLKQVIENAQNLFKKMIHSKSRIGDLGHSLMYKSCIELLSTCYCSLFKGGDKREGLGLIFIEFLCNDNTKLLNSETDYEILCLALDKIVNLLIEFGKSQQGSRLSTKLEEWLEKISLSQIKNDDMIIRVLRIFSARIEILSGEKQLQISKLLRSIEIQTENKHMKVAIFHFLLSVISSAKQNSVQKQYCQEFLQFVLDSYSNPNQLEDLRQVCVIYLEQAKKIKSKLLLVYLRLLEDQQSQIRKKAALQLSKLLKIKPSNEYVVAQELLTRFIRGHSFIKHLQGQQESQKNYDDQKLSNGEQLSFFVSLLESNSDYGIRVKNHEEERIFSYDKPNKYRTDINTMFNVVALMDKEILLEIGKGKSFNEEKNEKLVTKYISAVMQRDEYEFETLIRDMIMNSTEERSTKLYEKVSQSQPMLKIIYDKLLKQ